MFRKMNSYLRARAALFITLATVAASIPPTLSAREVGANDFRISDMGPDGDFAYDARRAAIAYNSADDEFLVVWDGSDDNDGQVQSELEIFIQRLDASTGQAVGANDQRITEMGGLGSFSDRAFQPAVAYNPDDHEYLVVWSGRLSGAADGVFGQRIDASTGERLAPGPISIGTGRNSDPAIVYNSVQNEYFVAWEGEHEDLAADEEEIFVRRIAGDTGLPMGTDPKRISTMGGLGNPLFDAEKPAVALDPILNRYLVVWEGRAPSPGLAPDKTEIYGQMIDGGTGLETGPDDFRVTFSGLDADPGQSSFRPAVAFDPTAGERGQYLVAFETDLDPIGSNRQIYARQVDPFFGQLVAWQASPISGVSRSDLAELEARAPALVAKPGGGSLVLWQGEHTSLTPGETEVFGRFLGSDLRGNGKILRLSDMGGRGDSDFGVFGPTGAARNDQEFLVAWQADDDTPPLVEGEHEIFGQRLAEPASTR